MSHVSLHEQCGWNPSTAGQRPTSWFLVDVFSCSVRNTQFTWQIYFVAKVVWLVWGVIKNRQRMSMSHQSKTTEAVAQRQRSIFWILSSIRNTWSPHAGGCVNNVISSQWSIPYTQRLQWGIAGVRPLSFVQNTEPEVHVCVTPTCQQTDVCEPVGGSRFIIKKWVCSETCFDWKYIF